MNRCGKIFTRHCVAEPEDEFGCTKEAGHEGPCRFLSDGNIYEWEVDMGCGCESCMSEDPHDWCTVYWRVK